MSAEKVITSFFANKIFNDTEVFVYPQQNIFVVLFRANILDFVLDTGLKNVFTKH